MSRGVVATAVLAGAGAVAVLAALLLPWWNALVLFGALDRIEGPFGLPYDWVETLPELAAGLGAIAVSAAISIRWHGPRGLALPTALVLAAGTVFLLSWSIDPPDPGPAGSVALGWGAYLATAALAVAAVAASARWRSA